MGAKQIRDRVAEGEFSQRRPTSVSTIEESKSLGVIGGQAQVCGDGESASLQSTEVRDDRSSKLLARAR